ncbi:hypothetical protein ACQEVC_22130 [Plantactinospora sp. CA-294935]|uniref:hypothetical protein n=1 Tax=Plantactinospora sp. CA-294935 TaxID=3240012 RepID=UPI003D90EBB9
MGRKLRASLLAVAGAAAFALGATPTAAHAGPVQGQQQDQAVRIEIEPQGELVTAAAGCPVSAYGYSGTAMCGTIALVCSWDEAFVIAPSRTVWHAWPGSGGWREMPNNGRADNMWDCYRNGDGQRQVEVWTAADNVYYSYYSGGWRGWYYYPGS